MPSSGGCILKTMKSKLIERQKRRAPHFVWSPLRGQQRTAAAARTCDHDGADVGSSEVLQNPRCLWLQFVLHDDQAQELHVGLDVIPEHTRHIFFLFYYHPS